MFREYFDKMMVSVKAEADRKNYGLAARTLAAEMPFINQCGTLVDLLIASKWLAVWTEAELREGWDVDETSNEKPDDLLARLDLPTKG